MSSGSVPLQRGVDHLRELFALPELEDHGLSGALCCVDPHAELAARLRAEA